MPKAIHIIIGGIRLAGELFDTPCAEAVYEKLPVETEVNEWGDEFYFEIPLAFPLDETATRKVEVGDIGYWPPGRALALFFGPTPMSTGPDPVPASEVNRVGRITDDPSRLRRVKGARTVRIEARMA